MQPSHIEKNLTIKNLTGTNIDSFKLWNLMNKKGIGTRCGRRMNEYGAESDGGHFKFYRATIVFSPLLPSLESRSRCSSPRCPVEESRALAHLQLHEGATDCACDGSCRRTIVWVHRCSAGGVEQLSAASDSAAGCARRASAAIAASRLVGRAADTPTADR